MKYVTIKIENASESENVTEQRVTVEVNGTQKLLLQSDKHKGAVITPNDLEVLCRALGGDVRIVKTNPN